MRLRFFVSACAAVLLVAGCADTGSASKMQTPPTPPTLMQYDVAVDSYAASEMPANGRYWIMPHQDCHCAGDLLFQELAGYIGSVLDDHGMKAATVARDANVIVALNYGMQLHPTKREAGEPVMRYFNVVGYTPSGSKFRGPGHGVGAKLWDTQVASPGMDRELRRVIPILAITSAPYLTKRTGQRVYLVADASAEMYEAFRTHNKVVPANSELVVRDALPMTRAPAARPAKLGKAN